MASARLAADDAAFEQLVAAHQKRVFRLALRMLGDLDEAACAAQDCFLRIHRSLSRCPREPVACEKWVVRLATNLCLDRLRSRKWHWWRQRLGLEAGEAQNAASPLCSPERELLSRELADRLALALRRLSPRQRAVFVLRHYEDMALDQIAGTLSLNVGTVKAHLSRALETMRNELKDFYGKYAS